MAVNTYPYLIFTDGTTTITFQPGDGTLGNYPIARDTWVPSIAGLRRSPIGGRSPYEDVEEEIQCTIKDTTAGGCFTKLDTLNRLLDQAERWYRGEAVSAVLVKFCPAGAEVSTTSAPLQAAILGRASGNNTSGVGLYPRWNEVQWTYLLPITIRFWRRGQWLIGTTAANSGAVTNGTVGTVDLTADLTTPGPTKVQMTVYVSDDTDAGYLIVTSNDDETRISVNDPTDAASGAPWTSVDESANFAQFTNVLRYTPAGTTEVSTTTNPTNITNPAGLVALFMNIRNNSNTTSFLIRLKATTIDTYKTATTPYTYIAPYVSAASPQWQFMGMVSIEDVETVTIYITASAAAGSIDIGSLALVNVSYPYTYILAYEPIEQNAVDKTLIIDHALLTKPSPTAYSTYAFQAKGDMVIETLDQNIAVVNLITDTASNDWRTTKAGSANTNTFTLTRYSAYLTPV